eukprot:CAMPEP_0182428498 /NCGR_PEP_ID=MMETSP1167-20130531/23065_1 /TAXON_ID=2988 /ORGANISM="Mallomonas Sp, Strain CCMP3275" /LENGTH=304 /DNA_ID=CAMNT_0024611437 /DNA_START=39 /DNA_END=950 /DNA_ORIENTATION=+
MSHSNIIAGKNERMNKRKRASTSGGEGVPFTSSSSSKSGGSDAHDDSVGHFMGERRDLVLNRYEIRKQVGLGTFGKVFECIDRKYGDKIALKIVRKIPRYCESAQIEADILNDINDKEKKYKKSDHCCVKMYSHFKFDGHFAMVFESLGTSLYDFIKMNNYRGLPLYCVRDIARQLLVAIDFLESMHLIHTDLKLENILLVDSAYHVWEDEDRERERKREKRESHGRRSGSGDTDGERERERENKRKEKGNEPLLVPRSTRIKVIDFGGATYDDQRKSTTINTRQYRGPEVILETGWSYPSDIW